MNHFGWIPFNERTKTEMLLHEQVVGSMPKFKIVGNSDYREGKVCLFELWNHPDTIEALGHPYTGTKQHSGCCVGAGGGNAVFSLIAGDSILRGDMEGIVIPFWLLPYGRSRFYMGKRSPGSGSFGSTFAKALREDGILDARQPGLPSFDNWSLDDRNKGKYGLSWGERTELSWSDGDERQTLDLLPQSKLHVVNTTAQCPDADAVREAIVNLYPVTIASSWGGNMECRVRDGVLLNENTDSWAHQMSVHAWWDHPSLGEIFWIHNQWGDVHGRDPAGGPPGGFWILKNDMNKIARQGETYALSGFDNGFPARTLPWDFAKDFFV